jgi:septal ring factor EnvC (AmiA/AmiB activator)
MEFILEQQAKLWAGLQQTREEQAELRSLVVRLAEHQLGLAQHLDQFQQETRTALVAVAEAQRQTAEALQHTDERLNALITVVDGVVRRLPQQ